MWGAPGADGGDVAAAVANSMATPQNLTAGTTMVTLLGIDPEELEAGT